ncbi:MAG: iron-sulfur cluster assembly scaffold protein [Deltaproteobacteria bacterium]|nr:iron-sulfur cluster assembly scaffold protein [Deltaproteobacteria bacterium]
MGEGCDSRAGGIGRAESECGDLCELRVWLRDATIERCEFRVRGCTNTFAAAAAAAAFAQGRTTGEALGLHAPDLLSRIGNLPPGTEHVTELAVRALHEAVLDAFRNRREPWRAAYRTDPPDPTPTKA